MTMFKNYSSREIVRMMVPYFETVMDLMTTAIILVIEWIEIFILMGRWMVRRIPAVIDAVRKIGGFMGDVFSLTALVAENMLFDANDLIVRVISRIRARAIVAANIICNVSVRFIGSFRSAWAFRAELITEFSEA